MIRRAETMSGEGNGVEHDVAEDPRERLERERLRLLEENARLRQELRDHATVDPFGSGRTATPPHGSLADRVGAFERRLIEEALAATGGIRSQAARLLRTTERILSYRIRRYDIDIRRFR